MAVRDARNRQTRPSSGNFPEWAWVAWTVAVVCGWIAVGGLTLLGLYLQGHQPGTARYCRVRLVTLSTIGLRFGARCSTVWTRKTTAAPRIQARLLRSSQWASNWRRTTRNPANTRGDYYDAAALDDTRILVTVADVSGKETLAARATLGVG